MNGYNSSDNCERDIQPIGPYRSKIRDRIFYHMATVDLNNGYQKFVRNAIVYRRGLLDTSTL
jgi:hypothetical protein